jgi:hypothetical protein
MGKNEMRKTVIAVAALAAALSTAALAKEIKGKQMNDAEMDKVTAGQGQGVDTACFSANGTPACFRPDYVHNAYGAAVNVAPGHGTLTRY